MHPHHSPIARFHIIAIALSSQIGAWKVRDTVEQRASRGKLSDLDDILVAVPDVPPVPGDEIAD